MTLTCASLSRLSPSAASLEPLLVSSDDVVISGHRRLFAASAAELETAPVIRAAVSYARDREAFLRLLVEANAQRKKTPAMLIREAAVLVDPDEALAEVEEDRRLRELELKDAPGERLLGGGGPRKEISEAKMRMLRAAIDVINAHDDFWPLSVRQVHYRLLGAHAPLRHAAKPDSRYRNDKASYKDLTDLLARGCLEGFVPWNAIDDETRPVELNAHYWNVGDVVKGEMDLLLRGYVPAASSGSRLFRRHRLPAPTFRAGEAKQCDGDDKKGDGDVFFNRPVVLVRIPAGDGLDPIGPEGRDHRENPGEGSERQAGPVATQMFVGSIIGHLSSP
jgi:hypothetical protein